MRGFSTKFASVIAFFVKLCYLIAMKVVNLTSGSDGNCSLIETENTKILLDDGINATQTIEKLKLLGVDPSSIDAIVVSHEHSDHIKGVDVFASKFNVPVFAHEKVWIGLEDKLKKVSLKNRQLFDNDFQFKDLVISPIEVPHDVACYGFSVEEGDKKISIVTDLGHYNDRILAKMAGSRLIYLESNYDREMLYKGTRYPLSLKRRIDGPNGHLSNIDSGEALERLAYSGTRQFVLAHLSKENNSPRLAYSTICSLMQKDGIEEGRDLKIDVATTNVGTIFRLK